MWARRVWTHCDALGRGSLEVEAVLFSPLALEQPANRYPMGQRSMEVGAYALHMHEILGALERALRVAVLHDGTSPIGTDLRELR